MRCYLSIAYSLSNISTENYYNRTGTVKIIVGGILFLRHSVVTKNLAAIAAPILK